MNVASTDRAFWRFVASVTAITLALLVALEWTPIDLALARLAYDPVAHAFPWREHPLATHVAHGGLRAGSALLFAWIALAVWKPFGALRRLDRRQRIYLLAAVVTCFVVVATLKRTSALHCPWGLVEFGGTHAYLRLFDPVPADIERGGCFPAGHALSAFAYVGGYFAWRHADPRVARTWLAAVLVVGAVAGLSQQARGAHFLSHTLWSAWLCWTLSAALAWLLRARLRLANTAGAVPL